MSYRLKVKSLNRVQLFATPWTAPCQAPPSMGFSRQEYWSGLPFPPPGDLPNPGIEPRSPALQADTLPSEMCYRQQKVVQIMVLPIRVVVHVPKIFLACHIKNICSKLLFIKRKIYFVIN